MPRGVPALPPKEAPIRGVRSSALSESSSLAVGCWTRFNFEDRLGCEDWYGKVLVRMRLSTDCWLPRGDSRVCCMLCRRTCIDPCSLLDYQRRSLRRKNAERLVITYDPARLRFRGSHCSVAHCSSDRSCPVPLTFVSVSLLRSVDRSPYPRYLCHQEVRQKTGGGSVWTLILVLDLCLEI